MYYFPLGELKEERYELSKRYKLVELVNGVHRFTEKAKRNYNIVTYIKYLRGELEKPLRIDPQPEEKYEYVKKELKTAPEVKNNPQEFKSPECQQIINEILSL